MHRLLLVFIAEARLKMRDYDIKPWTRFKSFITYFLAHVGNTDIAKLVTPVKCHRSDVFDVFRNINILQVFACCESIITDPGHGIRKHDSCKKVVVAEAVFRDRGNLTSLFENNLAESRNACRHLDRSAAGTPCLVSASYIL